MATTAGASNQRSWQRTNRPNLDEHSHKVWRWIVTMLAMVLIAIGIYLIIPPARSKTVLISFKADRVDYATVPPVPMLVQDEAAVLGWAEATQTPYAKHPLSELKSLPTFFESLFSPREGHRFETFDRLLRKTVSQRQILKKDDTVLFVIRGHGMAALAKTDDGKSRVPLPYLVTSFKDLKQLDATNTISVAELLKTLSEKPELNFVVVLDAVYFNYDPRLGQLFNEFPAAVAKAIPPQATNLTVIVPSRKGELTVVSPQDERTLFSLTLLDAWRAEHWSGANRAPVDVLVQRIQDQLSEARRNELDRDFWQDAHRLPDPDDPGRKGNVPVVVSFPTIPTPKKTGKEDEKPASTPVPAAEKKTAARDRPHNPWNVPNTSLAAVYQPEPAPATPTSPPTADPAATPTTPPATTPTPMPAASPPVAKPATAPAAAAPAADEPPRHRAALESYRRLIEKAWRVRDELQNWELRGRDGWSPVHFAPHQWRRLNAYLVAHEQRCRSGLADETEQDKSDHSQLLNDLDGYVNELERLLNSLKNGSLPDPRLSDTFGLSASWKQFSGRRSEGEPASLAYESFRVQNPGNALHEANGALKKYADCAYRYPEYVRLQGLMRSSPGVSLSLKSDLNLLHKRLIVLRKRFEDAGAKDDRVSPTDGTSLKAAAEDVKSICRSLDQKISHLARDLSKSKDVALPGRANAIYLLLESPLLPASERAELLDRLLPLLTAPAAKPIRPIPGGRGGTGSQILSSLGDQVNLEMQVIELLSGEDGNPRVVKTDNTLSGDANFCLSRLRELLDLGAQSSDAPLGFGEHFRQYYANLPDRINGQMRVARPVAERKRIVEMFKLYHSLLLVDGRDADRLGAVPINLVQPFRPQPIEDDLVVTFDRPQVFLNSNYQEVVLTIELLTEKVARDASKVTVALNFDSTLLEVLDRNDSKQETNLTIEVPRNPGKVQRKIKIRGTDPTSRKPMLFTAEAAFSKLKKSASVECLPQLPNEIELLLVPVHRWSDSDAQLDADKDRKQGTEARLFPNRNTRLKLMLRNLSSEDKWMEVKLIRIPEIGQRGYRLFKENGELLPVYQARESALRQFDELPPDYQERVVAETPAKAPLKLLAKGVKAEAVPLEFKAASNAPPAATGAAPAAGGAAIEVTEGLVCVITNTKNRAERYIRWIDLRPYAPHELYAVDNPSLIDGRLSFKVRLLSADFAEDMGLDSNAIKIFWDRADERWDKPPVVEGAITTENLSAEFSGSAPNNLRSIFAPLHIDGYPRAIILKVDPEAGTINSRWKEDSLVAVHVPKLLADQEAWSATEPQKQRLFLINRPDSAFTRIDPPEDDSKFKWQTLTIQTDQPPVVIRANRNADQRFTFDLQADISPAALSKGAYIEWGQMGQESTERRYYDRDVHVKLLSASSNGVLSFQTTVDDFRNLSVAMKTRPEEDANPVLVAAVSGRDFSDGSRHELPLILDRNPPAVQARLRTPAIELYVESEDELADAKTNPPVIVEGSVSDGNGSGVSRIKVYLSGKAGAPPLGDGKPLLLGDVANRGNVFQVATLFPGELKVGNYNYELTVEAQDLVGRVSATEKVELNVSVKKIRKGLRPAYGPEAKKMIDDFTQNKKIADEAKKFQDASKGGGS